MFAALSNDQLLSVYNRWSAKPVRRFESRTAGEARLAKLLKNLDITIEEASAPPSTDDAVAMTIEPEVPEIVVYAAPEIVEAFSMGSMVEAGLVVEAGEDPPAAPGWIASYQYPDVNVSILTVIWQDAMDWLVERLDATPQSSNASLRAEMSNTESGTAFSVSDEARCFTIRQVDAAGNVLPLVSKPALPDAGWTMENDMAKRAVKPAPKKKTAKPKPAMAGSVPEFTGKKADLFKLLKRKNGLSEKEGCAELGWKACGATIGRLLAEVEAAGMEVRKWKDDGRMRYGIS